MDRESLEAKAEKTLRDTDTFRLPVAIDRLAQRLNLTMEAGALGDDVSGMLIIRGERGAIGYNSAHVRVRQRFTIAHEIAHFLLHAKRSGKPQLFLDGYMFSPRCYPIAWSGTRRGGGQPTRRRVVDAAEPR